MTEESTSVQLTPEQLARIERKRQNAILLRQSKVVENSRRDAAKRAKVSRIVDSDAGFLIEEEDELEPANKADQAVSITHEAAPLEDPNSLICEKCGDSFNDSFLYSKFDLQVCDTCRDNEEEHRLISRSTAKSEYLLKDCDLDQREPALRFVTRPNPHRQHWGEMRLYLEYQVVARSHEVWGGEEGLESERERRENRRFESRQRKFYKDMKELRQAVRANHSGKKTRVHEHEFGEEVYDEAEDVYTKTCVECGHRMEYEKL